MQKDYRVHGQDVFQSVYQNYKSLPILPFQVQNHENKLEENHKKAHC